MRARLEEHTLGGHRRSVRAEAHPRQLNLPLHVVLRHQEVHDLHAAAVLDHEVHGRVLHRAPAQLRDLRQRLAGVLTQRLVPESDEQGAVAAGRQHQVFPIVLRERHLAPDAIANVRILQACRPRVVAALLDPRRHRGVEAGGPGGVVVHVRGDLQALFPGVFDLRNRRVHFVPVRLSARLEVIDLGADCASRAIVSVSSMASSNRLPSLRMCAMYMPPEADATLASSTSSSVFANTAGHVDERGRQTHGALVHGRAHVRRACARARRASAAGCRNRSRWRVRSRR